MSKDGPVQQIVKKIGGNTGKQISNYFGGSAIDTILNGGGQAANDIGHSLGLNRSNGVSLNDILNDSYNQQQDQNNRLEPPKLGDATNSALSWELGGLARKRAGRTLFTGGTGLTESPTTASSTLLGI